MKKFYTLALGLCFAAAASAQVLVGTTEYTNLQDAIDAAGVDGAPDVVTITADVKIEDRINIGKSITVEAINGAKIIVNKAFDKSRILINGGSPVLNNIILDGNNIATSKTGIEENNSASSATLNNVTIMNLPTSQRCLNNKKQMVLNNLKFENCTGEGPNVLVGANGMTIKGTTDYNVYVESTYTFAVEDITGNIDLSVETASARTIVKGGSLANFTWVNAPAFWSLKQNGTDIALEYTKPVARVGEKEYTSLKMACDSVANGGTIVLIDNAELTGRGLFGNKNVTIQSEGGHIYTIKRTWTSNNDLTFECNYTFTMKNVIYDQNNITINKPIFNLKGHGVFENVQVINANDVGSIIDLGGGKTLTIDDFELVDSKSSRVWAPGKVTLNGDTNLSFELSTTGSVTVGQGVTLTNETPIVVTPTGYTNGTVVVNGYTNASQFTLPTDADTNLILIAKSGNLVLADPATLEVPAPNIVPDSDAKTFTVTAEVGTIWYKEEAIADAEKAPRKAGSLFSVDSDSDEEVSTENGWTDSGKQTLTLPYSNGNNYAFAAKAGNVTSSKVIGSVDKDGVITAVERIEVDEDAAVEYFNLQGVRVANPENGVFIRRQGSKVTKVIL